MRILSVLTLITVFHAVLFVGDLKAAVTHLENAESFEVVCHFENLEDSLQLLLMKETIHTLQQIGTVCPADDKSLTKQQLEKKRKPWQPRMFICVSPKYEFSTDGSDTVCEELPILEISLNIQRGIEDSKERFIRGIVWQEEKFISTEHDDEAEYLDKVVSYLKAVLGIFNRNYQYANPDCKQKPHFFLLE
jgi:hypothetical protein